MPSLLLFLALLAFPASADEAMWQRIQVENGKCSKDFKDCQALKRDPVGCTTEYAQCMDGADERAQARTQAVGNPGGHGGQGGLVTFDPFARACFTPNCQ